MEILRIVIDFFTPRFVTEWVACYKNEDGAYQTAFSMSSYDPSWDEEPDLVVKVRAFSWFGIGWSGKGCWRPGRIR